MPIPLRVLIIEDNDDDLALILRELRRGDYEVSHERARTETEIRQSLAGNSLQAILCCDDGLPHLSAPQVLEIAKEIAPHLPFLLVSGAMNIDHAIETVKAGADDHIPKDNLARLVPALQRELAEKARTGQAASAGETAPLKEIWRSLTAIRSALQSAWIDVMIITIGAIIAIALFIEFSWSERLGWVNVGTSLFVFVVFIGLAMGARYGRGVGHKRRAEIEVRAAQLTEEVSKRERIEQTLTENNQTFRTFIHTTPLAVISLSLERKVQLWNAAAERMFGWKQDEVIGKLMPPSLEGSPEELVRLRDFSKRDSHIDMEVTRQRKDGSPIDLSLSIAPLRNAQGRINGTILVLADITERKHADTQILKLNRDLETHARNMKIANEQLKRESEERAVTEQILRNVNNQLTTSVDELKERTRQMQLLGEMSDALQACSLLTDAYPIISHFLAQFFPANIGALYLHDPARKLVEIAATWGDVKEQYLETIFTSEDCWALRRGQFHHVTADKDGLRCKHAQHTPSYVCIPMSAQGETLGILHMRELNPHSILDATGLRLAITVGDQLSLALANLRLRDELRQQAIRDPITKLFNRRYMEETLIREVSRAQRNDQSLSVIMIDIDHFKEFNDSFGHEAGDLVLQSLARFLSTRVRGSDVACRYGGEEFTLILPSATLDLARKRAEQIREGIQSIQVKYGGQTLGPITLSLGVAVFPDHGVTGEAILQLADAALYRAKQTGRNRVVISSE
ncbi:MAG: diguanylate cyclase [Chloroflexi bacterium]|nr:diguanylate cyclase [Chloroflexota bacterium]